MAGPIVQDFRVRFPATIQYMPKRLRLMLFFGPVANLLESGRAYS